MAKDGLEALFDVPPLTCYSNLLKSYRCEEPFPTFALRILEGECCALYDLVLLLVLAIAFVSAHGEQQPGRSCRERAGLKTRSTEDRTEGECEQPDESPERHQLRRSLLRNGPGQSACPQLQNTIFVLIARSDLEFMFRR